jgi:hypothetical protein
MNATVVWVLLFYAITTDHTTGTKLPGPLEWAGEWDSKEGCERGAARLGSYERMRATGEPPELADMHVGKAHICQQSDVSTLAHEEQLDREYYHR